ncbi:MAG: DUF2167 domain-containing protein [Pseudoxanthomonas sp.]
MKAMIRGLLATLLVGAALSAVAQAPETERAGDKAAETTPEQLIAALHFKDGDIAVPQADAHFRLTPAFRYLEQADARRVLEDLWGNPPDQSVLGMIVPAKPSLLDEKSWAVVVTYADEGYVSDEDAAKIDYQEMLQDLQKGTREDNAARKEAGYGTVDLVGWAVDPRYDAANKKMYWAKELKFDQSQQNTLNYDIRVLGRRGYLSLNAISGMSELGLVQTGMQQLLPMAEFDTGARYADYNESTDKVAAYGVAALIGGGLAAKAGLFAKIGLVLAKFWKLGLIAFLGLGAVVRKLFRGKRDQGSIS